MIRLEKNKYEAGETAKGTLLTEKDKRLTISEVRFAVCGKERYEEFMAGKWGNSSEKMRYFSLRTSPTKIYNGNLP